MKKAEKIGSRKFMFPVLLGMAFLLLWKGNSIAVQREVDYFEGYADTPALGAAWADIVGAPIQVLVTTVAYQGSKAMEYNYNVGGGAIALMYVFDSNQNWSGYSTFTYLLTSTGAVNSGEYINFQLQDEFGATIGTDQWGELGYDPYQPTKLGTWTPHAVNISGWAARTAVRKIKLSIVPSSWGSGRVYFDEFSIEGTNSPGATGFQVFTTSVTVFLDRSSNTVGTTTLSITTGAFAVEASSSGAADLGVTTLTISGLTANTTYSIQARAVGTSTSSSTVVTASTATLPAVPGDSSFVGISGTSITITWQTNGNSLTPPTSYQVDVSSVDGFGSGVVTSSITFEVQASSSGLFTNTTYYFAVKAFGRTTGSASAYNTQVSTTTGPLSPAVSSFQIFYSSVSVFLTRNGNAVGADFRISTGTFETSNSSAVAAENSVTTITISGLTPNTNYAVKSCAFGAAQSSITVVTASTFTLTLPPALSGFQVFATSVSVSLGANGNSNGTTIMVSTGNAGHFNVNLSSVGVVAGTTTLVIHGLVPNTPYMFQAGSLGRAPQSSTNTIAVSGGTTTLAQAPLVSGFNIWTTSITVFVNVSSNPLGTGLALSTGMAGHYGVALSSFFFVNNIPITTVTVTGLSTNTAYGFQAGAWDGGAGASTQSVIVTASTQTLAVPPGVVGFNVYTTSVSVVLDSLSNPTGTKLVISTGADGNLSVSLSSAGAGTSGSNTTLTIFNLTANSVYEIQAAAVNGANPASTTTVVSVSAGTTTLAAAPIVSGFKVFTTSVTVFVNLNGNAVGTPLAVSTGIGGHYGVALSSIGVATNSPVSTVTVTGLSTNTVYGFQAGMWGGGASASTQSAIVTASTTTLVAVPIVRGFKVFTTSVTVFVDVNGSAVGTPLAVSTGIGGHYGVTLSSIGVATNSPISTITVTGLSTNTAYGFQVGMWGGGSPASTQSAIVTASTATLPAVPGTISFASVSASSITMSWNNNGNSLTPPTSYQVNVSTWNGFVGTVTSSITFLLQASTAGLSPQSTYFFQVRAFGLSGINSAYNTFASTVTIATAPAAVAPSTPAAFTVTAIAETSITFGWSDSSNNEDGFRILNSTSGVLGSAGAGATSLSITGLTPNQQIVSSGIVAYNSLGASTQTASISSYTLAYAPGTPNFVTVKANGVTISWSSNTNPSTVIYEVTQTTNTGGVFGVETTSAVPFSSNLTSTFTTIGSLSVGGTYWFRIRARNGDGVATAFTQAVSTVIPPVEATVSTGGVINAGATTVTTDAGVTVTNTTLSDGSTQQTFTSTQTATVTYGTGIVLTLPAGVHTVLATLNGFVLTSTQTVPLTNGGITIEITSGTLTIQTSGDTLDVILGTNALQSVQTTLPTSNTKTLSIMINSSLGTIKASIPPGAFTETVRLLVRLPVSFPVIAGALGFSPLFHAPEQLEPSGAFGAPSVLKGFGAGLEISLDKNIQPVKPVQIVMDYRDSDISGSDPKTLVLARYEESAGKWITLPSAVNTFAKQVTGATGHLSTFQLMALAPATDINNPIIYPNPLQTHRGQTDMTFTNLSADTSVKIYSYMGEMVRELRTDVTGTVLWDARNYAGDNVASGVYIVLLEAAGSRKRILVAVEK